MSLAILVPGFMYYDEDDRRVYGQVPAKMSLQVLIEWRLSLFLFLGCSSFQRSLGKISSLPSSS